jgi:hypothetical protein
MILKTILELTFVAAAIARIDLPSPGNRVLILSMTAG